jgi:hypothetical protein
VKNQYFGDARDYFKYDVLERLASDLTGIDALTCLWMLTRSDGTSQGQVKFVPDPELTALTAFFHDRLDPRDEARCQVSEMSYFFADRRFRLLSYRDDRDDFDWMTRARYFRDIPAESLSRAVVFFDPDTGIEPRRCTAAHLRFDELKSVVGRMDDQSVAVIFQFQRRVADCDDQNGRRSDCEIPSLHSDLPFMKMQQRQAIVALA